MKFIQYKIGDIVQMKKKHPCVSQEWEVVQLGTDMRIKCCNCERVLLIARPKFIKGTKKILNRDMNEKVHIQKREEENIC